MTGIKVPTPTAELTKVPDTKENDTKLGSSAQRYDSAKGY